MYFHINSANTPPMIAAPRDISSAMLLPAPLPPACALVVGVELELADEVEVVVVLLGKLISTLSILSHRSYTSNLHNIETKRREKGRKSTHPLVPVPVPAGDGLEVVAAAPVEDTETPGKSCPRHKAGIPAAKELIWSEGQALMQVIRLVPMKDWQVHWSRAAPVYRSQLCSIWMEIGKGGLKRRAL
jgi:hypothetical protein